MRTPLLVCGLLFLVIGLGVLAGLSTLPTGSAEKGAPSALSTEPERLNEKSIPVAELKDRLHLRGVAVVDLQRLLAAHPFTAASEADFAEKLSDAQSFSNPATRAIAQRKAEIERDESRRLAVNDIKRLIKAYATTNALTLVLDRSANPSPGRAVVEYSSSEVQFHDIARASGVRDITQTVLHLLESERPNNGLHWTAR